MRKITRRAVSVLLIAALVIVGMVCYTIRYIDDGQDWALYFSNANSGSTGEVLDRYGNRLAYIDAHNQLYAENARVRMANYHVTGDYWGRSGTGILSNYWNELQGFSLITGTTKANDVTLELTVDAYLNASAYDALGDRNGAIMVMNYKTGEVLCMVSTPVIDPAEDDGYVPEGAYINRCLNATFAPGSIFKLITAAAAIEKIPDIYDRTFYCEGEYEIAGVPIVCSGVHYTQTFEEALANSCNVAFAKISVMLGQDTLTKYVEKYGFLDRHELDELKTSAGSYPTEFVGDPELAWSGIGQSVDLICPYSMLRYVAAIANGGVLVEPTLIIDDDIQHSTKILKAETASKLKSMMSYNVSYSYGGQGNFPGYELCAKTGTAELGDGTSHAWFTGFLTDEDHPYAFVVLVERGGGGLSVAGNVASMVLNQAINRADYQAYYGNG